MFPRMKAAAVTSLIAATSTWLAAGCATMNVHSYLGRGVDLRQYRTYDWGPPDNLSTGDPRLDNNRFFDERLRVRVEAELARRGFEKTTSKPPDLLVHYHARVSQQIHARELDPVTSYCADEDCQPLVYEQGTLLIDLVEPRTEKLIWRGWAEGSIAGVVDNQAWMESRIDEAVAKILARLPHRL